MIPVAPAPGESPKHGAIPVAPAPGQVFVAPAPEAPIPVAPAPGEAPIQVAPAPGERASAKSIEDRLAALEAKHASKVDVETLSDEQLEALAEALFEKLGGRALAERVDRLRAELDQMSKDIAAHAPPAPAEPAPVEAAPAPAEPAPAEPAPAAEAPAAPAEPAAPAPAEPPAKPARAPKPSSK